MVDDFVPFGSQTYVLLVLLLLAARGLDFLSTWIATPNLVLEGNPIAKRLGWKWGIPINLALCFALAYWPMPAIVISTTSVLVAARNLQSAWLMRSLGEKAYRQWHTERIEHTSITLYLFCLFGQTILTGAVGLGVLYFCNWDRQPVLMAIGLGIIGYAVAVAGFTLFGVWRLRRAATHQSDLSGLETQERPASEIPDASFPGFQPSGK